MLAWIWGGAAGCCHCLVSAWGYPCAFPVLRGDKCKYQRDIFHSLCQAVNKALAWKLSLFNNKIFKSYTVLFIFQVNSSWILPVSTVLVWGTQTLSQKLLSFRDIPPRTSRAPLPQARHRTGMKREWPCAFVNVFSDISKCSHSVLGQKKEYSQQNIEMKFLKSFPTPE